MWFIVLLLFAIYLFILHIKRTSHPYYQLKKEENDLVNNFVAVNKELMKTVNKPEVLADVQNKVSEIYNRPDIKLSDDLETKIENISFDNIRDTIDSLPTKAVAILWCYITNEINNFINVAKISKHDFYYLNIKQEIKSSIIRVQKQMKMVYLHRQDSFKLMASDFIIEHLNLYGVDDSWYELWADIYRGFEYYNDNKNEFEKIDSNLDLTDINSFPNLDEYDY